MYSHCSCMDHMEDDSRIKNTDFRLWLNSTLVPRLYVHFNYPDKLERTSILMDKFCLDCGNILKFTGLIFYQILNK